MTPRKRTAPRTASPAPPAPDPEEAIRAARAAAAPPPAIDDEEKLSPGVESGEGIEVPADGTFGTLTVEDLDAAALERDDTPDEVDRGYRPVYEDRADLLEDAVRRHPAGLAAPIDLELTEAGRRVLEEVPLANEGAGARIARLDDWRAVEAIRVTADEDTPETDRAYFARLVLAELQRRIPASAVSPAVAHAAVSLDAWALETILEDDRSPALAQAWTLRAGNDE